MKSATKNSEGILKRLAVGAVFLTLSVFLILACARIATLVETVELQADVIRERGLIIQELTREREPEIVGITAADRLPQTAEGTVVVATVTAYSPHKRQTDGDPLVAASMRQVREGTVAVSRDLFWAGWTFGRKVYIEGHGVFEINDLMNERHERRIDVFRWSKKKAVEFGATERKVALLGN